MPKPPAHPLRFGEALANIEAVCNRNPRFSLWAAAGRYVLICAITDPDAPEARAAIAAVADSRFNEAQRLCILMLAAPSDATQAAAAAGKLVFADADAFARCRLGEPGKPGRWIMLDPTLRAAAFWPLHESEAALAALAETPDVADHAGTTLSAPILIAPRIFEADFCRTLIDYYERTGGEPSGITVQNSAGGVSIQLSPSFKKRFDCLIADEALRGGVMHRIFHRLLPEIEKAFMWRATHMERYLIACYDAAGGGYFRPHRDNTTSATLHRRFAVTINLNADEYDGGDLRFPEFGAKDYRAPTGGAVVFSCALMHEALPVTRGKRYAFLPFLYDETAAATRKQSSAETIRAVDEA